MAVTPDQLINLNNNIRYKFDLEETRSFSVYSVYVTDNDTGRATRVDAPFINVVRDLSEGGKTYLEISPKNPGGTYFVVLTETELMTTSSDSIVGATGHSNFPANSLADIHRIYKVVINVTTPVESITEPPECYFKRVTKLSDTGYSTSTLYLENVTSVTETYRPSITDIPIPTKPARERYVMDLGTVRTISVSFSRANPANYNNDSDDSRDWSNSKWITEFRNFFDLWQNSTYDEDNHRSGGFRFRYIPSDPTLYDQIDENVFLNGTNEITYGLNIVNVTINLVVASMLLRNNFNPSSIRLMFAKSTATTAAYASIQALEDVPFVFPSFEDVEASGTYIYWTTKKSNGKWYPNQRVEWEDLPAGVKLKENADVFVPVEGRIISQGAYYTSDKPFELNFQAGYTYKIILVGGGGSSGVTQKCSKIPFSSKWKNPSIPGAGAGGEVKTFFLNVNQNMTGTCTLGAGGHNGENGGATSIEMSNGVTYSARGGEAGYSNSPYSGGHSATPGGDGKRWNGSVDLDASTENMGDGYTGAGFKGLSGKGSNLGAGGGAANLNEVLRESTGLSHTYLSKGGNPGEDGVYGGGGGSKFMDGEGGRYSPGGKGIIIIYQLQVSS